MMDFEETSISPIDIARASITVTTARQRKNRRAREEKSRLPVASTASSSTHYRRLINIHNCGQLSLTHQRQRANQVSRRDLGKGELALLQLIGQSNETVKRAEGLILIEGYAAGNNRQLAEHQTTMRLGFADNRLREKRRGSQAIWESEEDREGKSTPLRSRATVYRYGLYRRKSGSWGVRRRFCIDAGPRIIDWYRFLN